VGGGGPTEQGVVSVLGRRRRRVFLFWVGGVWGLFVGGGGFLYFLYFITGWGFLYWIGIDRGRYRRCIFCRFLPNSMLYPGGKRKEGRNEPATQTPNRRHTPRTRGGPPPPLLPPPPTPDRRSQGSEIIAHIGVFSLRRAGITESLKKFNARRDDVRRSGRRRGGGRVGTFLPVHGCVRPAECRQVKAGGMGRVTGVRWYGIVGREGKSQGAAMVVEKASDRPGRARAWVWIGNNTGAPTPTYPIP
jgi:hypothetical protein